MQHMEQLLQALEAERRLQVSEAGLRLQGQEMQVQEVWQSAGAVWEGCR